MLNKTKSMLLARSMIADQFSDVKTSYNAIDWESQVKYFGIVIAYQLFFDEQVNICMKKLAAKLK